MNIMSKAKVTKTYEEINARIKAGEAVVVRGAQLLLSEELKFQIRNENED